MSPTARRSIALCVFARPPRPGRAKTRLAATIGASAAAALAAAERLERIDPASRPGRMPSRLQLVFGGIDMARFVIIADPAYHRGLLDHLIAFRTGAEPPAFVAAAPLVAGPDFTAALATFTTLGGFLRYAATLPPSPIALARRLRAVRRFTAADAPAAPAPSRSPIASCPRSPRSSRACAP